MNFMRTLVILVTTVLLTVICQAEGPNSTDDLTLKYINLTLGGYNIPYCIEMRAGDEGADAIIGSWGAEIEIKLPIEYMSQAQALIEEYRVFDWDGFSGSDSTILDGEDFSFNAEFSDGSTIYASGSNYFPDNYKDFKYALMDLVQPAVDEYWEEFYKRPIVSTEITHFTLIYGTESGGDDRFKCIFSDNDGDGAYHMKAIISTDDFDIEPYASENISTFGDNWFAFDDETPNPPFSELQDLAVEYDISQWNGWDEFTPENTDEPSLDLYIEYESGEYITITGRTLPEGFMPFIQDATEVILDYISENHHN